MEYRFDDLAVALVIAYSTLVIGHAKAAPQGNGDDTACECSLATVKGLYGVLTSGTLIGVGPIAANGRLIADGAGHFTYYYTENTDGSVSSGSIGGTYTVNAGCRGTATYSNGYAYSAVVVSGGNEIDLISTVPSSLVSTAVAKRIDICGNKP